MWCGVLGPLLVRTDDGTELTIAGRARRVLFAALVSHAGTTVGPDTLIEDVWGMVPPRSALGTLRSHVVRLRDDLGRGGAGELLVTSRSGYRLELGTDDIDAMSFDRAVRAANSDSDPDQALAALDHALALWRGDAYQDFTEAAFTVAERIRLADLRALAEERRTDFLLTRGDAAALIPDLEKRVADAPYRERGWEQLVVALYRAGRQADALGAYRRARDRLAEDLGVDPGPELRLLEERILRQDPDLLVAAPEPAAAVTAVATAVDTGRCPYVGLASYGDGDSDVFVGRERLTAELAGRIAEHRVVVVAGASGSGKSSLLRAGLVPALRADALPGSAAWRVGVRNAADDLPAAIAGGLDLLVVDQAEELFSRLDASARTTAVDALEQYAEAGGRVVLVIRGDFYARLAEVQPFGAYAQAATVLVGPMRADEVRRVVIEPAQRVGLVCDDDLVETVMDDIAGQPAALPLLSAALVRTWENRAAGRLTLAGYRAGGGVARALEATAEAAYDSLDDADRLVARRLFVRLAQLDDDMWVRRSMRRSDAESDDAATRVLGVLAAARLVTITPTRVEITHDALLIYWPRLREWLADRVRGAELLGHLETAAQSWAGADRPASDLYRGVRLQSALEWRAEHPDDLSETETAFLAASAAAADAELVEARERAEREAHGRRRLRSIAVALAAVLVVAIAVTLVAVHERTSARHSASRARASALDADARRLAALSIDAPDIETSSLLAIAGYRLRDSSDTRGALLNAVERNQSALWRLPWSYRLLDLVATPDGKRIAAWDNHGHVDVFDTARRAAVADFFGNGQGVNGITADGRQVIVTGGGPFDPPSNAGRVCVTQVSTGTCSVLTLRADPNGPAPVMTTDARWLAVLTTDQRAGGVVVDVFDARNWHATPRTFVVPSGSTGLAAGRSAFAVQHGDGSVEVHDVTSLAVTARFATRAAQGAPFATSPDGSAVAVIDRNDGRRALLYRVHAGAPVALAAQASRVNALAFSRDGRQLAVATDTGPVAIYTVADGSQAETLTGASGAVIGMVWTPGSPEGLYTTGLDSQLVSWSTSLTPRLVTQSGTDLPQPDRGEVFGRWVLGVTPNQNNAPSSKLQLYLLNVDTGVRTQWPLGLADNVYINQAVASFDGSRALISLQSGDDPHTSWIEIWDLTDRKKVGQLALPSGTDRFPPGLNAAISPDGRLAYSSLGPSRIGVFDLPSGRYLRDFTIRYSDPDAARIAAVPWMFLPDGHLLFGGFDPGHLPDTSYGLGMGDNLPPNQRLGVVDVSTGRLVSQTGLGDVRFPTAVAWSNDGKLFAVGTYQGTVSLYDADSLKLKATAGFAEPGTVMSMAFSPDDRSLVTAGSAGLVDVWSVPDLGREGGRLQIGNAEPTFAWYDRGGRIVGLAPDPSSSDGDVRWFTFPAQPASLVSAACALAGTDMTAAQWARYVGDRPYQHVCPATH